MDEGAPATADGPARRRASWSLKTIVEDVAGVPISDLQDPERPVHPYLKAKTAAAASSARPSSSPVGQRESRLEYSYPFEDLDDPVARVYPPLIGPTGRELHGKEREHHTETIERLRGTPDPPSPGTRPHAPGPSRRPERIYLHYLLLHIDRLGDAALRYLKHAVDEEIVHRETPPASDA